MSTASRGWAPLTVLAATSAVVAVSSRARSRPMSRGTDGVDANARRPWRLGIAGRPPPHSARTSATRCKLLGSAPLRGVPASIGGPCAVALDGNAYSCAPPRRQPSRAAQPRRGARPPSRPTDLTTARGERHSASRREQRSPTRRPRPAAITRLRPTGRELSAAAAWARARAVGRETRREHGAWRTRGSRRPRTAASAGSAERSRRTRAPAQKGAAGAFGTEQVAATPFRRVQRPEEAAERVRHVRARSALTTRPGPRTGTRGRVVPENLPAW